MTGNAGRGFTVSSSLPAPSPGGAPLSAQVLPGGHHLNTNDVAVAGYQAQVRIQAMALTGRRAAAFMKDDADRLAAMRRWYRTGRVNLRSSPDQRAIVLLLTKQIPR